MNFPEKYTIAGFDISPYSFARSDEYIKIIAKQWHVSLPREIDFRNDSEKEIYEKQFKHFCEHIFDSLKKDLESGAYRDYAICNSSGELCGIVDVGKIYFSVPEVGLILKEEYRGRSIGYLIMKDFIERVKKSSKDDKVIWRTEVGNTAAIALASKLGAKAKFFSDDYLCFII